MVHIQCLQPSRHPSVQKFDARRVSLCTSCSLPTVVGVGLSRLSSKRQQSGTVAPESVTPSEATTAQQHAHGSRKLDKQNIVRKTETKMSSLLYPLAPLMSSQLSGGLLVTIGGLLPLLVLLQEDSPPGSLPSELWTIWRAASASRRLFFTVQLLLLKRIVASTVPTDSQSG